MAISHAMVIVNPAAGASSTRRKWPLISRLLKHLGLFFDYKYTEGVGHAIELAKEATTGGYSYIVATGGDGTVNEVANGILRAGGAADTALGVISTGTGSDFIRSVGIPRDYELACSSLVNSHRTVVDVGIVEYRNRGKSQKRFFLNAGGVGFDAVVVQATQKFPKYFGGTIPYLGGLIGSLFQYRNKNVVMKLGDRAEENKRIFSILVANGRYVGGGMKIAPSAELNDNLLDVVIVGDLGKFELLQALHTVYKGTHVTHPKVRMEKSPEITISCPDRILVHADGELLGEGPASFRLMPLALSLII